MENQRVRLTKRLLSESLLSLMEQKAFEQISVVELCNKAGVNRATFYRYYSSPIDILKEIQTEANSSYGCIVHKDAKDIDTLTEVLQKTRQNMSRARIFNDMTTESLFSGKSTQSDSDIYYKLLADTVPEEMREYARFMTSAAMTVWLKNGCDLDEKKFSTLLIDVCKLCKETI